MNLGIGNKENTEISSTGLKWTCKAFQFQFRNKISSESWTEDDGYELFKKWSSKITWLYFSFSRATSFIVLKLLWAGALINGDVW